MCCAYLAMSQSLMVPNAEKTDRMSSSVRSRWMLARYNLKTRALNSLLQSTVIILNQPVVTLRLSHNFINAGLGLGHLARPSHLKKEVITGNLSIFLEYCLSSFQYCISSEYFDIPATDENSVHLVESKLCCFWLFELHKGKALQKEN